MLQSWIVRWVGYSSRHFRGVIAAGLLLAVASAVYTTHHFAIDTSINDLISAKLPWRQQEITFRADFPQIVDLILVDIEAPTPEAAEAAAQALQQGLAKKPDLFRSVRNEQDSPFFQRNGLLFLPPDQVGHITAQLTSTQPMIGELVSDPSLRGLVNVLVGSLDYSKQRNIPIDNLAAPLNLVAATVEGVAQGRAAEFSWKALLQGDPQPSDLHRIVEVWPVLDHAAIEPGHKATTTIEEIVSQLGLHEKFGATVSLTGAVPISDNELAAVQDGVALNGGVTGAIVIGILWLALRSFRLVGAVVVNLAAGLAVTAAGGFWQSARSIRFRWRLPSCLSASVPTSRFNTPSGIGRSATRPKTSIVP